MLESLARNWWLTALRGLLALILGVVMLFFPIPSILFLVIFFGAYALVDGIFAVVVSLMSAAHHKPRWWLFVEGLLGILVGVAVFAWPAITAMVLLYLIAFWALVTGIFEIIFSAATWKALPNNWLWLLSGILSVLLGAIMIAYPGTGALAVVFFIAIYLIMFGVVLMALGFTLKGKAPKPA